MRMFGIGTASPSYSLSSPAMMRRMLDFPEPFRPSTPIFAPGKNEREMSFRMKRFGGTILPTRFMVNTYWAMDVPRERKPRLSQPGWWQGSSGWDGRAERSPGGWSAGYAKRPEPRGRYLRAAAGSATA